MTTISVVIATYGNYDWALMASSRAMPSVGDQEKDQTVVVYEREGTRATSLNEGASQATSEWLIFLDADDELAPGYVGAMRRALERSTDGNQSLFTPAVQQIRKGRPGPPFFFPEVDLAGGNWLVIGTMISKALFDEIGGFREHPHGLEDWNLWNRAVRAGARIVKVKDAVYRAYVNPQSAHHRFQRNRRAYMAAYEVAKADV